jgi:hypothetical protein
VGALPARQRLVFGISLPTPRVGFRSAALGWAFPPLAVCGNAQRFADLQGRAVNDVAEIALFLRVSVVMPVNDDDLKIV